MKHGRRTLYAAAGMAAAFVLLLAFAGEAVRPAAWALAAAFLADIPVSALEKHMKRAPAVILVFALAVLALAAVFSAVLLPAVVQLSQLPDTVRRAVETGEKLLEKIRPERQTDFSPFVNVLTTLGTKALPVMLDFTRSLAGGAASVFAVGILAVFYLLDWKRLTLRMALLVPVSFRTKAINAVYAVKNDMTQYLRGQIIIILTMSGMAVLALTLLNTSMPLAMGIVYGVLNAVPYFGPLVATVPPVLAAFANGWQSALMTLGVLLLIQQADNYIISPRIIGTTSNLGPAAVLLSVSVGSAVAGVWGMFLALPVAVAVRAVFRTAMSTRTSEHVLKR